MQDRVIILMGSGGDEEFTKPICATLRKLDIPFELRVASAHKTSRKLLDLLETYGSSEDRIVYITVAGRSNALSGFVDANSRYPVIACPQLGDKNFRSVDLFSSLRMPSGVSPLVILAPENAALAAAKILALANPEIRGRVVNYQHRVKRKTELDDAKLRRSED